jgi:excisionase family DNA binding protein
MMSTEKDAYTVKDVAARLQIGTPAVYEMVAAGRIPSVRFGRGSIRIPVKEFEVWIQSETRQTVAR